MSIVFRVLLSIYFFNHSTVLYIFIGCWLSIEAIVRFARYKKAIENMNFTSALIDLSLDLYGQYGQLFVVVVSVVVCLQSILLIAWGWIMLTALASMPAIYAEIYVIIMIFSLYWTMQLFNSFLGFVLGGSIVWYFIKDLPQTTGACNDQKLQARLIYYTQAACTTGLGTICKVDCVALYGY